MRFLRWVGDFTFMPRRATEPGRHPGHAVRTVRGQVRRVGSGTAGRCMGFLRWVGDFTFTPRRATEPGRHPGHAVRTVRGQLRRVGSGTV
jgi:hypothetical protein